MLQLVRDVPLLALVRLERLLAPPELLLLQHERRSNALHGFNQRSLLRRGSIGRALALPRALHDVLNLSLRLHLALRQLMQDLLTPDLESLQVGLDRVALGGERVECGSGLFVSSFRVARRALGELELVADGILSLSYGIFGGHRGGLALREFSLHPLQFLYPAFPSGDGFFAFLQSELTLAEVLKRGRDARSLRVRLLRGDARTLVLAAEPG